MKRYKLIARYLLASIAFLLLGAAPVTAQQSQVHSAYLKNGSVTLQPNTKQWLDRTAALDPKEPIQVIVQCSSLPTDEQKRELAANGVRLMDYIPDNSYIAVITFPVNESGILESPVYAITESKPEWKAGGYIWNKTANTGGTANLLVSVTPGVGKATLRQYLQNIGAKILPGTMEQYGAYKIRVDAGKIYTLAMWYGISYISPLTDMIPLDLQSRPAVKGNIAVAPASAGGYALTGDGVVVGVGDNASGIYHADLVDRITNFNPVAPADHGEHVNGIVGGAGNLDPLGQGMATHTSLLDFYYDQVLTATGAMYNDHHMTITNNSYGVLLGDCDYAGTYDIYTHFLDTLAVQYPEVLTVFASGNDGGMSCSPYPQGFATVGGGYQPAKNIVVVGSMTDLLFEASDESRGPVKDGRLKPEIVAVGLGAYSTIGRDAYEWAAGTSMACPQVSGGLALLTERYKQLNGGTQPKADLLKAILLNGGMDLGNPGPDYSYGFGSMDLYRSLQIIDNGRYSANAIGDGKSQAINITVPANTAQLKVMLYWADAPASPLSAKQLVNDLDLTVSTPSSVIHKPLVLDATPANVNNNATEQADHLNNVEQVTINAPVAGTYTINTNGYNVPSGLIRYVLAYDIIPQGTRLTYPIGGEQLSNVDTIRIFWDAIGDGNKFTLELSTDNGGSWSTLSNNIPADVRFLSFMPSGINSGDCLIRITRNGTSETMTSGRFAINTRPRLSLSADQCPGYVNVHWSPTPKASSYILYSKQGPYMQVAGTATDTTFSFGGMSLAERSYVAVQPVIDGINGYRSVAVSRVAADGNCNGLASLGDILVERIVAPVSGRMNTSTRLAPVSVLQVKLRNLYGADCNNYAISWQVNGGPWQTANTPAIIPAKRTALINVAPLNLSTPGSYTIRVAIENLDMADPQQSNDSAQVTINNLPNDPIDLSSPFTDDFESMGVFTAMRDSLGVSPNAHWDFFNTNDSGRMRSFVSDDVTISGTRSVSLDDDRNVHAGSENTFAGTFNLSNYDTSNTEVRLDFDYVLHAIPATSDGNKVLARASDTSAWMPIYTYDLGTYPGTLIHTRSLSLTDAARLSGKNFSSSGQVSFGQNDTSLIAASDYGNGLTLDNFKMYTVTNDAVLAGIVSPPPASCGLPVSVPLTIKVHNGVSNTLHNVRVYYTYDNGPVNTGTVDSIKGKTDFNFTFARQLELIPGSTHTLNVWLNGPGDSYLLNDSILNYHVRNTQVVTNYPYLENFESGDGGYYSDGYNNSWQYGTPSSPKINKAASGAKAWKTNLSGTYNNLETSYLYSPCFDISQLTKPMLSFSAAMEIENCGNTLCDAAYVEYSLDGVAWHKLGLAGQGTNWYDSLGNVWRSQNNVHWHVATIPIAILGTGNIVHFRFALKSDPGATFEGLAIDDIHVYDFGGPILPANGVQSVSQELSPGIWTEYAPGGTKMAAIQPSGDPGNTEVVLYQQSGVSNTNATQYVMPRSYTIKPTKIPAGANGIRLYLLDSEVNSVMKDTTCPSCGRLKDAYSLGVTRYHNANNTGIENGSLADDTGGVFTYYPRTQVSWVPYDKGYYAEFSADTLSEFWFNDGGPSGNLTANADYLSFLAYRSGTNVSTYWYSPMDTGVNTYTLQRSRDGKSFVNILDTAAIHHTPAQYAYTDAVSFTNDSVLYYRLRWTMTGGKQFYYSPIRKIDGTDSGASLVTLDARMIDHSDALVNWHSFIDPMADHYKLERAIGDRGYTNITNVTALRRYGQQYYFNDAPGAGIRTGTPIHYRLTVKLTDGTNITLPVKTIEWVDDNAIVSIYPNPSYDGVFTITWHADAGTVMNVEITDAIGKTLFNKDYNAIGWTTTTTVTTGRGPKGVYFVRIAIDGKKYAAKIVFE